MFDCNHCYPLVKRAGCIRRFKMRSDIQSYHLGGMGCGTGVVGINLVRDLLKARPNSVALFVPSEITTYAFYDGKEKQRMVANAIFRMGGAAIMFTNKPSMRSVSKYQLVHAVRVHQGCNSDSYGCMSWGPDGDGVNGVYLGKNLVACAGAAIESAIRLMAPRVMTWQQYGEALYNMAQRNVLGNKEVPDYVPDFTKCISHFAIHAGKVMGQKLSDTLYCMIRKSDGTEAVRYSVLYDFVATYSVHVVSQTVLQLGVGGGVKAGCNVWRALRNIQGDRAVHSVWEHLEGKPMSETDLPRGVEGGDIRDSFCSTRSKQYDQDKVRQLEDKRADTTRGGCEMDPASVEEEPENMEAA
ncbi:hypothetical protein CEUSTIGMA_g778.t1 [Chlamydomonas eustigma]|uniref:FAE domain-containing protein n=1 Tax=Chlamydomonas eustigma TaxID=1157962 RepID=A0A250WR41_9CHLO|nr:hypothetical protein CEUSTIGMA_g778.t1 [Chlamydomonas eustigma]|eukprot:GAX73324.1 hypothetical protein CEUSTIGMA_g778.t1 [Chlamydomonas eustigma]